MEQETTNYPTPIFNTAKNVNRLERIISRSRQWVESYKAIRSIFVVAVFFPIYFLTLAPTIYNLDSAELTTAAATGGITRATGYPLYLILGNLWSKVPIGDIGFRMNLLSAVFSVLALIGVETLLRRWKVNFWVSISALGLLAFSFHFWVLSLIAEVYTFQALILVLIILAISRVEKSVSLKYLFLSGFIIGCGLSHHAATVLLLPAIGFYFLATLDLKQLFSPKIVLSLLAGFLLGISFYLYLPIRYAANPAFNYAGFFDPKGVFHPYNQHTWDGFWRLVSGRDFWGIVFGYSYSEVIRETRIFAIGIWRGFFGVGVIPGLIGAGILIKKDRKMGITVLLMFIFHSVFFINYRVVDKVLMFLPSYLIWAVWIALGLQWFMDWISENSKNDKSQLAPVLFSLIVLLLPVFSFAKTYPAANLSNDWETRENSELIFNIVEENALIIGTWDVVPPLHYLQLVEGKRPDVQLINSFLISKLNIVRIIQNNSGKIPIYIDSPPRNIPGTRLEKVGSLYKILIVSDGGG